MEKTFKVSVKLKVLFYFIHLLIVFFAIFAVPLFIKILFNISWAYFLLILLINCCIAGIWNLVPFFLFMRAIRSFKNASSVVVNDEVFYLKNKSIPWTSINGLIFNSVNGVGFIATKSLERFLGYFVLKTSVGDCPIPFFRRFG